MNHLLGFQILVHIVSSVIFVVMFGYFFSALTIDSEFYWPYLVLFLLPCIRILLIGHWGQVLEHQVRRRRRRRRRIERASCRTCPRYSRTSIFRNLEIYGKISVI